MTDACHCGQNTNWGFGKNWQAEEVAAERCNKIYYDAVAKMIINIYQWWQEQNDAAIQVE